MCTSISISCEETMFKCLFTLAFSVLTFSNWKSTSRHILQATSRRHLHQILWISKSIHIELENATYHAAMQEHCCSPPLLPACNQHHQYELSGVWWMVDGGNTRFLHPSAVLLLAAHQFVRLNITRPVIRSSNHIWPLYCDVTQAPPQTQF